MSWLSKSSKLIDQIFLRFRENFCCQIIKIYNLDFFSRYLLMFQKSFQFFTSQNMEYFFNDLEYRKILLRTHSEAIYVNKMFIFFDLSEQMTPLRF